MSQLGWIDFSPDHRNKASNLLALLSEPGTLDELGIGQVRDAYSNALFPGISTIQTRATGGFSITSESTRSPHTYPRRAGHRCGMTVVMRRWVTGRKSSQQTGIWLQAAPDFEVDHRFSW